MKAMEEPAFILDGARVAEYAGLDFGRRGDMFGLVVGGVSLDARIVSRVALVENLADDRVFLLHCNDRWETLAAEGFPDLPAARRSAAESYGKALGPWTPYRALSAAEAREIETTRAFLREIG
jgi:hypothetical protein